MVRKAKCAATSTMDVGRDFEKEKKRKDEPQGGISWPDTIQDTEDEVDMDMNRYTLENKKTRKNL